MNIAKGRAVSILSGLLLIVILAACGGGSGGAPAEDSDPSTGKKLSETDLITLSALEYDNSAVFTPKRMLASSTVQLNVKGTTSVGDIIAANDLVSWSSSNEAVVKVDANGLVTGVAVGKADISATWSQGNTSLTSSVAFQVRTASLNIKAPSDTVFVGDKLTLSVTALWDDNTSLAIPHDINLQSSAPEIASFNNTQDLHELTAHQDGAATISANYLGLVCTLSLEINKAFSLAGKLLDPAQINLQWIPIAGAISYTITWWTSNFFGFPVAEEIIDIQDTSYVHSGLGFYSKYAYKVTANLGYTKYESNTVVISTPQNNATTLQGDIIGKQTAVIPEQALRRIIKLETGTLPTYLQLGKAYMVRDKADAAINFMNIVVPVSNTSAWVTYCSVEANGPELRDPAGMPLQFTPLYFILSGGGVRDWGGTQAYNNRCIAPGATAYFISVSFAQTDPAKPGFMDIDSLYIDKVGFWSAHNSPVKDAVIPQSYLVIPPTADTPNQQLNVVLKNIGQSDVVLYDPSATTKKITSPSYLLLDENMEPVSFGYLSPPDAWDGLLAKGASLTVSKAISQDTHGATIHAFVTFYKAPAAP